MSRFSEWPPCLPPPAHNCGGFFIVGWPRRQSCSGKATRRWQVPQNSPVSTCYIENCCVDSLTVSGALLALWDHRAHAGRSFSSS